MTQFIMIVILVYVITVSVHIRKRCFSTFTIKSNKNCCCVQTINYKYTKMTIIYNKFNRVDGP